MLPSGPCYPRLLDLGVKITECLIPHRQGLLGQDLDADLLQVRQEFSPFRLGSKVKAPWPVREVNQWTPHGLSEQTGQVIDGGRFLDGVLGKDVFVEMAEDDSPPNAVVFGIGTRNGEEVGLPGGVVLIQAAKLRFDKER